MRVCGWVGVWPRMRPCMERKIYPFRSVFFPFSFRFPSVTYANKETRAFVCARMCVCMPGFKKDRLKL